MSDDLAERLNAAASRLRTAGASHAADAVFDAKDRIEALEAELASIGDPSRTSRFEYGARLVDGRDVIPRSNEQHARSWVASLPTHDAVGPLRPYEVVIRTVTYTSWRPHPPTA